MPTELMEPPAIASLAGTPAPEEGLSLVTLQETERAVIAQLARPEKCNPISLEVIRELDLLLARLAQAETTKPFVLRGAGKWFGSGGDLRQFATFTADEAVMMAHLMAGVLRGIERLPGPTVAAFNGPALGGAIELALAFDIRVASSAAYLRFAQTRMGITTGWQGIERLNGLVGYSASLYLLLTGQKVPADEALRLGLVNAVWPAETFEAELERLIASLREAGEAGLAIKRVLREGVSRPQLTSGELERKLLRLLWDRPQRRQAMLDALPRHGNSH